MPVGHMRVSTVEQNPELQRATLELAAFERLYGDICSGFVTDRPRTAKGVDRKVLNEVLNGEIDTTSSTGGTVFGISTTLTKFERDLIKKHTLTGLAAARAR